MTRANLTALAKAATPERWHDILASSVLAFTTRAMLSNEPEQSALTGLVDQLKAIDEYVSALSPEVVLKMLACIEAAVAMRNDDTPISNLQSLPSELAFDAALSALDAERAP